MNAMLAQKDLRSHRDRLLQLLCRLQQQPSPSDDYGAAGLSELARQFEHIDPAFAGKIHELAVKRMDIAVTIKHADLAPDIAKVYYVGIQAGARCLTSCLEIAAENGALSPAFAVMPPDDHLYDALLAQPLPACPTTQTEALARVEAAFYAVKLSQEHHLPRCIEKLTGIRPRPVTGEPEDEDDPVAAAAAEHLAETDISDPAPAAGATREPGKRSADVDKARDYLDRACTLVSLAVKHMDRAVAVLSSFLDPKEVASLSDFTDRAASISEDRFLQFN